VLYLLPEMKQLINLAKVEITAFLMVFNHFSVDKCLPLFAQPFLLSTRFFLHRRILLLHQPLPTLLALVGYLLSDPELAKDTLEGVKALQCLIHESQGLFIMGFVLSIEVELHKSSAALDCLIESATLGSGWIS